MIKTCFKCHESKPLSDFYKHPEMADGYLGKCRACAKTDVRKRREVNLAYIQEYDRNRPNRLERSRKQNERLKALRKESPECRIRRATLWEKNKKTRAEKYHSAHYKTANAIRDGKLIKQCCQQCQSSGPIHAHHEDYSKPLDVVWLCKTCHYTYHKNWRNYERTLKGEPNDTQAI